jgi:hypothetical protein
MWMILIIVIHSLLLPSANNLLIQLASFSRSLPLSHQLNILMLLMGGRKMPLRSMTFVQQITVHLSIFCITLSLAVAL